VVIPNSATLGLCVFDGVTKLDRLTLVGSPLSRAVIESLEHCLTSKAKVIGVALAGQMFGRFTSIGS
jgi:hypothetical protein